MRLFSRLLPALLLTLSTTFAFAITNTFTGTGNWMDPSKWSLGVIPWDLYAGDVIIINGNCSYGLKEDFEIYGDLQISKTGVLTIIGRNLSNRGTITIDGTLNISTAFVNRGQIKLNGIATNSSTWENISPLTVLSGASFTNNASGNFSSENTVVVNPGGIFTNNGRIFGNISFGGNVLNAGTISPGHSPGNWGVTGNYTASPSAIHTWEVGGNVSKTYDHLQVTGTATLNGTLNVTLINGYIPSANDSIVIMFGNMTGAFSSVNIPSQYVLRYTYNSVILVNPSADVLQTETNVATGVEALKSNTTGYNNSAFGYTAMALNTVGHNNTAVGARALQNNMSGEYNTGIGVMALYNNNGTYNTAIGTYALSSNVIGHHNTAIGPYSLEMNTNGSENTATGYNALKRNTIGYGNTAHGASALSNNVTGGANTAIGGYALLFNATGSNNTANGYGALMSGRTGGNNTAIGYESLRANTGHHNTAIGVQALYRNTTGENNLANGAYALFNNTTGNYNTAFGYGALNNNISGSGNITSGAGALASNSVGSYNMVFGANALGSNVSGDNNIAIGVNAAYSTRSVNSTFIGPNTYGAVDISNATAIGNSAAVLASNQIRLGNVGVTSIGGQVEWTTLSDGRFKANVSEDVPGLSFIIKLRPVTYTLDIKALDVKMKGKNYKSEITTGSDKFKVTTVIKETPEERSAKEARAKVKYTGFVAQEVEEAAKKLDYDFSGVDAPKSEEDVYGIRYSAFVVPLVKSVQEQQKQLEEQDKKIEDQHKEIGEQHKEIKELKTELEDLKGMVKSLLASKGIGLPNTKVKVSSAYLVANAPNPFNASTVIRYHIPDNAASAKLVITNMKGQVMKTTILNGKGDGQITLSAGSLASGSYNYSLWIGNEQVDTKQMLIVR